MMNPTLLHMSNYLTTEDGIAGTTGYSLPPNGWASVEARVAYDNRVAMASLDVQEHTLQTNVSLLTVSSKKIIPRAQLSLNPLSAAGIRT